MIYDLCCGAGLAADGYAAVLGAHRIRGFDLFTQPSYPYAFTQANVMTLLADRNSVLTEAAALHTSFPCQEHTTAGHLRQAQGGGDRGSVTC